MQLTILYMSFMYSQLQQDLISSQSVWRFWKRKVSKTQTRTNLAPIPTNLWPKKPTRSPIETIRYLICTFLSQVFNAWRINSFLENSFMDVNSQLKEECYVFGSWPRQIAGETPSPLICILNEVMLQNSLI